MRGWDEGADKKRKKPVRVSRGSGAKKPMKPSSDRSVRVCTEGGFVGGWVGWDGKEAGPREKGWGWRGWVMVLAGGWGGCERARRWRELIETSALLQ